MLARKIRLGMVETVFAWRGEFANKEVGGLHAEVFEHGVVATYGRDWVTLCARHSLGWVSARQHGELVGFVNIPWDGQVHAWIQDLMVASTSRHQRIGVGLVRTAIDNAKSAGCLWLHVDFDEPLRSFYYEAAGFSSTSAGVIDLTDLD